MKLRLRIPIRVKFMLTFLVLVSAVVGIIVFSTANLFQEDKKVYVNDLTSMIAVGMAEEARSTLDGYRERLYLYGRLVMQDSFGGQEEISRMLFDEFPELVAILIQAPGEEPAGVYNLGLLESFDRSPEQVVEFAAERPIPAGYFTDHDTHVRNSPFAAGKPTFTIAFEQPVDEGDPVLISAMIRSERLRQLVTRSDAYDQFIIDSAGALLAHADLNRLAADEQIDLRAEALQARDEFSGGVAVEYDHDGIEMIGAYGGVGIGRVIAGAEIPSSAANYASTRVVSRLILLAGLLLIGAVLVSVVWSHRISRPMEDLSYATQKIASGDFDIEVKIQSRDELGDLAQSFNHMATELIARDTELNEAHGQLVQSEKMSAFGQLGAGIAHEVKNPLTGILACAQLAAEEVPEDSSVFQDLKLIEKESKRCKQIIENLLKFARQEKAEVSEIEINDVVADSIAIVNHQLELNEVRVEKVLDDNLPTILGNANQLQQVFINLLINAQQAMGDRSGKIQVSSLLEGDGFLRLRFADNGPGIPKDVQAKIFEPFYTTKPPGEGTGLGLSVSFGIVRDHGGEITIESEVGVGTTFIIALPAEESTKTHDMGDGVEVVVVSELPTPEGVQPVG